MHTQNTPAQHAAVLDANFAHLLTAIHAALAAAKDAAAPVPTIGVCGLPASGKTTQSQRLGDAFLGLPIIRFDRTTADLPDDQRTVSTPRIVIIDDLYGDTGRNRAATIRDTLPAGSILILLSQDADIFPDDANPVTFFTPSCSR